jgi:cytochrome P450
LDACCKETLRLHPLVPHVSRRLQAPLTVRGFEVPIGASAAASLYLAHQRAESFPEPRKFLPERFLGKTPGPFEYLPFGGGSRRCLGASFALYEMKLVFAAALKSYTMKCGVERELRTVRGTVTLGPELGAPMRLVSKRTNGRVRSTDLPS